MWNDIWDHITAGVLFVVKIIFWQWYRLTQRLIELDLRLNDIENSLNLLRDEHDQRRVCQYQEELRRVQEGIERLEQQL